MNSKMETETPKAPVTEETLYLQALGALQPYQQEIVAHVQSGKTLQLLKGHRRQVPFAVRNPETGGQVLCYL